MKQLKIWAYTTGIILLMGLLQWLAHRPPGWLAQDTGYRSWVVENMPTTTQRGCDDSAPVYYF